MISKNGKKTNWEFFKKLNEVFYVSDMDTYEVVYMNDRCLEILNVERLEDVKGRQCYEVIQKRNAPCDNCTNKFLKEGEFYEWQNYNHNYGKMFGVKDTMVVEEGKRLRVELALDLGAEEELKKEIEGYAYNESVLNKGMELSLHEKDPNDSINVLLKYLGEKFDSQRAYIFEKKDKFSWDNTYEWCAHGVSAEINNLQNISDEILAVWVDAFQNEDNVIIRDLEEIKSLDPLLYEVLKPQKINSLVVSPIVSEGKIVGFFGVDNPPVLRLNNVSTFFNIAGNFFTFLLKRRDTMRRLHELSYLDQLTGLGNRHAMQEYIDKIKDYKNIGIVYCDVMGLKAINDTKGHQLGDDLLVRASICLKDVFEEYEVFRVGGDEFLVICTDVQETTMHIMTTTLRNKMEENDALMAVGMLWIEYMDKPFNILLKEVDERMYNDKQIYYNNEATDRRCSARK